MKLIKIKITKKINTSFYMKLMAMMLMVVLSLNSTFIYAVTSDEYFAGNQLKQIGILKGYTDGTLKLEQSISRAEVATIMVRVRGYENTNISIDGVDFTDVASSNWAYLNIQNAYKLKIIQGYPDLSFKPLNNISYAEVIAIMVNTLGYKESVIGDWPENYINKAKELGVIPDSADVDPTKIITRGEMSLIVWDTLLVKLDNISILE